VRVCLKHSLSIETWDAVEYEDDNILLEHSCECGVSSADIIERAIDICHI